MAETTGTKQGFTWRHIMVVFTCAIGIFTSTAITFSCAGLTYIPISEQLGIERIQITFYMTCTYLAEVVFSPVVGAMLERLDIRLVAVSCACAADTDCAPMRSSGDLVPDTSFSLLYSCTG